MWWSQIIFYDRFIFTQIQPTNIYMHYFWKLNKYVILYYQKLYKYLKTIYCLCVLYSAANFTIRLVIHQQIFYMKLLGTLCTKILTLHIKSGWANGAMCYVANVCTEKNVLITYLSFYLTIIRKKSFLASFHLCS